MGCNSSRKKINTFKFQKKLTSIVQSGKPNQRIRLFFLLFCLKLLIKKFEKGHLNSIDLASCVVHVWLVNVRHILLIYCIFLIGLPHSLPMPYVLLVQIFHLTYYVIDHKNLFPLLLIYIIYILRVEAFAGRTLHEEQNSRNLRSKLSRLAILLKLTKINFPTYRNNCKLCGKNFRNFWGKN